MEANGLVGSPLVNFKHKNGNLRQRKRKTRSTMVSYWKQPSSLKQRNVGRGVLALSLVLWLAVCLLEINNLCLWSRCPFEMDVSAVKSLSQTLASQKEKLTVKAYTTKTYRWNLLCDTALPTLVYLHLNSFWGGEWKYKS